MKCNLILMPAAILATLASANACAADVTLYGILDTGFLYQHIDSDIAGKDAENLFQMSSGVSTGSRWGIKGSENLGNGLNAGFVLESGFSSDDGVMGQGGRLFGREAQLYLDGAFGRIAFGRYGSLASGSGSYALAGDLSPFGTTWGDFAANAPNVMAGFDRYDNMITYRSPIFAGLQVHAQYSFGTDSTKYPKGAVEGKSSVDRYAALGLTYEKGSLNLVAVVDTTDYSSVKWSKTTTGVWGKDADNAATALFGGAYDFGGVILHAGMQYFRNVDSAALDGLSLADLPGIGDKDLCQMKGFGITTGVEAPLFGGTAMAAVSYADATIDTRNGFDLSDDGEGGDIDFQRLNLSVGYSYKLSARTSIYGVASYSWNKFKKDDNQMFDTLEPSAVECAAGLVHRF